MSIRSGRRRLEARRIGNRERYRPGLQHREAASLSTPVEGGDGLLSGEVQQQAAHVAVRAYVEHNYDHGVGRNRSRGSDLHKRVLEGRVPDLNPRDHRKVWRRGIRRLKCELAA